MSHEQEGQIFQWQRLALLFSPDSNRNDIMIFK